MQHTGYAVVALNGLWLYTEIYNQPAGAAYRLAKEADHSAADAIFISCTNFRTVAVLPVLEQDLGKPVISANQVTVWDLLRLAKVRPDNENYGQLAQVETASLTF